MSKNRIVIIVAMQAEADPIIEKLRLKKSDTVFDPDLAMETFELQMPEAELFLVTNGKSKTHNIDRIGTQAATLATWEAIRVFQPQIIINAGTAGGFSAKDAKIGEVYLGKSPVSYHDRRIPLPAFESFGIGAFPCLELPELIDSHGLSSGHISSGNALDATEEDFNNMRKNKASVKEMEAAAIAEVAELKGIPFVAVKAITDFVDVHDEDTGSQFERNFSKATQELAMSTEIVVNYVAIQLSKGLI